MAQISQSNAQAIIDIAKGMQSEIDCLKRELGSVKECMKLMKSDIEDSAGIMESLVRDGVLSQIMHRVCEGQAAANRVWGELDIRTPPPAIEGE